MQHQKTSTFIAARNNAARQATLTGTVRLLWPYIWPADRADLKLRVFLAVALMLLSKLFTIAIPYSYKWATDAVASKLALDAVPLPRVLIGAAALTALYGVLRILMAFTQQGRDALFAAVAMNAVRRLAIEVFEHLHRLSLRFHLERKTGGLTRVLERGRNAIETIIRTSMLTAVPTAVEFALVVAAMLISFDWRYVVGDQRHGGRVSGLYDPGHQLAHRHSAFDERERHRRQHQGDRQPAQFRDGEIFRRRRPRGGAIRQGDGALRADERAHLCVARGSQRRSGVHFHPRPDRRPSDVRRRGEKRNQDRRRLRAGQPDHAAALPAAQFHGDGLSRYQAGDHRRRGDVRHPGAESRDRGHSRRAAFEGERRRGPVRECRLRLRSRQADPARRLVRGARGAHDRHRRAVGRRQVDDIAAPVPVL